MKSSQIPILQDQRAALRWVQKHIGAFGGNPDRVTLFGESAGAFSICFHLTSPPSWPLFHGAIMESPSCGNPMSWLEQKEAQRLARGFAAITGCSDGGYSPYRFAPYRFEKK